MPADGAAPRPRLWRRPGPWLISLVAGALTAALLFGAYTVRIVDLASDRDLLTEMNRTLSTQHARRLAALLEDCHGTFAVDRGVRQLRGAVCGAIDTDLAAVRSEPLNPSLGTGEAFAERALQRERKHWRVSPSEAPDVARFDVNSPAFERLNHYADQPIGSRLVVREGETLMLVDIDHSTTVDIAEDIQDAVVLGDWVAVSDSKPSRAIGGPAHEADRAHHSQRVRLRR